MKDDEYPAGFNSSDRTLLTRLDERTQNMKTEMGELKKEFEDYVRREEFMPVKMLVFGMVAIALTAIVTALVALIVSPPGVIGGGPPL